ncbi:unnamed protein product [Psylliodes chrysocephalus]|uniref:Uncharacterized protein n=1 Tax=Psylliodes chrysocephalus TaxID=3402493 RepID=A0A9P0CZ20_9CUCU|nr:unnamed protein product [Psylliodes chrysocephala]
MELQKQIGIKETEIAKELFIFTFVPISLYILHEHAEVFMFCNTFYTNIWGIQSQGFVLQNKSLDVMQPFQDYGPKLAEVIEHLHVECSILTGATDPEIDNIKNGNFDENNKHIKRYNACLWLHSDALIPSNDGVPNLHGNKNFLLDIEPPKLKGKFVKMFMRCIDEVRESALRFVE